MKNKKVKSPNETAIMPPVEDAFLKSRVASATDCTGYAVTVPISDEEAESYGDLVFAPCVPSKNINCDKK